MECLKLTHNQQHMPFKVVYRKTEPQQKGVQRFLSVDPMAHLRSWVSPYSYCQNNPLNRVDLNGLWDDNYTIDKKGNIQLVEKTNDDFDVLYTKKSWDNGKKDNSIKLNKEVFKNGKVLISEENGLGDKTIQAYSDFKDDEQAESLFKFMSKNTENEWRLLGYGNEYGTEGKNLLMTSKSPGEVISSNLVDWLTTSRAESIRYDYHNHPSGNPMFSSSDAIAWYALYTLNPSAIFKIYTPQNDKFTRYKF
jgi:hypothetical protein